MADSNDVIVKSPRVLGRVARASVSGGDGVVTALKDGGGRLLKNVHVVLIFWGNEWTQNPALSQETVVNAIKGILTSAYLARLAQYRNIGPATFVITDLNAASEPNAQFTNDEVSTMIEQRIELGKVPKPSSLTDPFYCVIMPKGVSSKDHTGDVGYHYSFDSSGTTAYCAWVTNDGTITDINSITKVFSHELVEACSDPDGGSGITVTSPEGSEIGDVCNNTDQLINNVAVQAYWSQRDGSCVLPQAYSARWSLRGRDGSNGLFKTFQTNPPVFSLKRLLVSMG